MQWQRNGDMGMVCEPFRVGKFTVDEGALCTLYGLWKDDELIGYFNSFEECKEVAESVIANAIGQGSAACGASPAPTGYTSVTTERE